MDAFNGRRILVTGATGFIGTHLCAMLEARGASVLRLSRSLGIDVTDSNVVDGSVAKFKPQSVFHLASRVTGSRNASEVLPTFRDNTLSTVNVLLASREHGVERVVCIGSLQEPDATCPSPANSPYAASKQAATAYVQMFASLYKLSATIARPFMVYGPGQKDTTKVLPYVITRILAGSPADLSNCRHAFDWIHVRDVVEALLAIHDTPGIDGRVVDIGTGHLTSVRDVLAGAASLVDSAQLLRFGALEDRAGEPLRSADVAETLRMTGWKCRTDLAEGLRETVDWYATQGRAERP